MLIQIDKSQEREEYQHKKFMEYFYEVVKNGMTKSNYDYLKRRSKELGISNQQSAGWIEGLGQKVASYDAEQWFRAQQHDRYHWRDESTIKQYKQDNPEVVIRQ